MTLTVAELRYLFTANTASLDRGFAKAQAGVRSMEKAGTRMAATGTRMTKGLTLPILAVAGAAGKMGSDYQASMQKIVGLVGISQKQVSAWSKQILSLSEDLPQSPKELADAMFFITSAGFRGKAALDVLTASAKASAAGLGDTAVIADAVTSAVNAYGIKNLSASDATDVLTAAVKEGKLEASSLAPVLGRVIPIASELGISFDQVGAAAAVLSKTGLNAAEATTAVRQIMQSLIKPTAQGKKELDKVGLSYAGLRKQVKEKGLFATLMTLRRAFGDNTEALSKVIPQVEGFGGVLAITGKGSKDAKKVFDSLANATGTTEQAFRVASKTAENRFKTALGKVTANAVRLGLILLPVGTKIVEVFANMVKGVSKLPGPVLKSVGAFLAVLAALGPILVVGGKVLIMVAKLRAGFAAMSLTAAASKGPLAAMAFGIKRVGRAMLMNPLGILITSLALLVAGFILAYKKSETFRRIVHKVLKTIGDAGRWLWDRALKPAFKGITRGIDAVGDAAKWLWRQAFKPAWAAISGASKFLWRKVIKPVFDNAMKQLKTVGKVLAWFGKFFLAIFDMIIKLAIFPLRKAIGFLWNNVVKPIFRLIGKLVKWLWDKAVKPYFKLWIAILKTAWKAIRFLWDRVVRPVFGFIGDKIRTVWRNAIRPVLNALIKAVGKSGDAFERAKDHIARAWNKIKNATKKPINFVINTVYNNGIRKLWNKVANFVGARELPAIPTLERGGKFSTPTAIVGEGNTRHPEFVIPTDPKHRKRAQGLYSQLGPQLMEKGGILGKIKDIGKGVINFGKRTFDFFSDPIGMLRKMFMGPIDKLRSIANTPFGEMIAKLPRKLVGMLVDKAKELWTKITSSFGGGGGGGGGPIGAGVAQWQGTAIKALRMAGAPLSWLGSLMRRMNQESGGNPRAINLWDSNARAGIPSKGLMQTIDPTFNAYAGALRGRGVWDPLANIYAAIRYTIARYGSGPAGWNQPGGYKRGSFRVPRTEQALVHKDEMILPSRIAEAVRGVLTGGSSGERVNVTVNAPQSMNPHQVGDAVAQRVASVVSAGRFGSVIPI